MKACKKVKKLLTAYACKELENSENEFISIHLETCSACKREYDSIRRFIDDVENLKNQNEQVIQGIDWENNGLQIEDNSMSFPPVVPKFRLFPSVGWKILVPVLVSVFVFGILVGYFLFGPGIVDSPNSFKTDPKSLSFNRINTTLARKEILDFFKQIQLLLLDVVKQCDSVSDPVLIGELDQVQVRQLLVKNRYLSQDLNDPQLMSTRNILKEIELLLYEILVMSEQGSCQDIRRLQNIIRQERIFLKIRLIEKDLFSYEV